MKRNLSLFISVFIIMLLCNFTQGTAVAQLTEEQKNELLSKLKPNISNVVIFNRLEYDIVARLFSPKIPKGEIENICFPEELNEYLNEEDALAMEKELAAFVEKRENEKKEKEKKEEERRIEFERLKELHDSGKMSEAQKRNYELMKMFDTIKVSPFEFHSMFGCEDPEYSKIVRKYGERIPAISLGEVEVESQKYENIEVLSIPTQTINYSPKNKKLQFSNRFDFSSFGVSEFIEKPCYFIVKIIYKSIIPTVKYAKTTTFNLKLENPHNISSINFKDFINRPSDSKFALPVLNRKEQVVRAQLISLEKVISSNSNDTLEYVDQDCFEKGICK